MYAYDLHELRFLQERAIVSAADALAVGDSAYSVPKNKLWTIVSGRYNPSATETRTIQIIKTTGLGINIPLRVPVSIALGNAVYLPLLTEGNQIVLYPGEYLGALRDVATAGSTMTLVYQWVESDLPTMKYHDPQKLLSQDRRKRGFARGSILGSAAAAIGGHSGEGSEGGGEGGGGPLPI